jgi:hypothetical protein
VALSVLPAVCIAGSTVVAGHLPSVSEFLVAGAGAVLIANGMTGQVNVLYEMQPIEVPDKVFLVYRPRLSGMLPSMLA